MKFLAFAVAVFSFVSAIIAQQTGEPLIILLTGAGFICAFTTYLARAISSFLKIFAAVFAAETVLFGGIFLLSAAGFWPASMQDYMLPESLPITVALFAILVYTISYIPVVRSMTQIADRYFSTSDRTSARIWPFPGFTTKERSLAIAAVVFLVIINQLEVALSVRLNFFRRDWYNALQAKDAAAFWYQIIAVFAPVVFTLIATYVIEFVVQSTLIMRWRKWLTIYYQDRWLDGSTHYRMSLSPGRTDNPDQRISEDVNRFIAENGSGYGIYTFSILLISKLSSLVSYAIILWTLSENFTIPLTDIIVPGLMFWVALIYAAIGTTFTHLIGRPLVHLSFAKQTYEADFRFQLARLREYGEQVALLRGEGAERISLTNTFGTIVRNYFEIVDCRKKLMAFTTTYGQIGPFIPYFIAAPFYFLNKITLGVMTQAAGAFEQVNESLTFFVTYYVSLAEYKSVVDRLVSFDTAIHAVNEHIPALSQSGEAIGSDHKNIDISAFTLDLPNGQTIVKSDGLQFVANQPVLLTGPSGAGKSTLFRAISGIWPFGDGAITIPAGARVMLLPQKPYLPIGSLKAAIAYPSLPHDFSDAAIRDVLIAVQLDHFVDKLEEDDIWSQRLSGGEQQRLSLARAILEKPDWLFLDEATGAMEEAVEAKLYEALAKWLPGTTIISIGHRASLVQFHKRYLEMRPTQTPDVFTPADIAAKAVE